MRNDTLPKLDFIFHNAITNKNNPRRPWKPKLGLRELGRDVDATGEVCPDESLLKSTDKSDNSSFVLIGNAYAALFDSANLITSVSMAVSNGISFPFLIYHVIQA